MTGYEVNMIVACINANGVPDLFKCTLSATQDEIDLGIHYDMAKQKAEDEGYEAPFVAYEEREFTTALKMKTPE